MSRIEGQAPLESIIPGLTPSHQADHAKKAPSQDTGKAGKDEVDVSSRAKNLNRIAASLETVPDIRVDKVSAIKDAIEAGTYDVAAKDVADAIVRDRLTDEIR